MADRELQRLSELFVGTWRGDEQLYPTAWDPTGGAAVGTWTVRSVAGGRALALDYVEERAGAVCYEGHGVHACGADGRLCAYWFDSTGAAPSAGTPAEFADDRYTYTWVTPRGHTRFTYAWAHDELTFTIERSTDGAAWAPMHVGRYRRS